MSQIDRQRIAAVRTLERLGYKFEKGEWTNSSGVPIMPTDASRKLDDALQFLRQLRMYHYDSQKAAAWPPRSPFEVKSRELLGL